MVLPALNEAKNIGWVLDQLPDDLHEVILVDGRSMDNTVQVALDARPDLRVLTQRNRGKGAAVALGLTAATGDIAVVMDADGSMDPAEISGLVGALLAGADVAKGSRATAGGGSVDLTLLRKIGNRGLTVVANVVYRQNWRELCYGYTALWTDVLPLLRLSEIAGDSGDFLVEPQRPKPTPRRIDYGHGFEIEAIVFSRAIRARLRVAEVFSFEHERRNGVSHLATWRDGWRVLNALLRERRGRPSLDACDVHRDQRSYPVLPWLHATTQGQKDVHFGKLRS